MANELANTMNPSQFSQLSDRLARQMAASAYKATKDHLASGGSIAGLDKGLDKGADTGTYEATGGGTEKGLRTHVSGKASSIAPMTALIGNSSTTGVQPSTLAANIFSWYDLFPPINVSAAASVTVAGSTGFTASSAINVISITPAQLGAASLGQQPPQSVGGTPGVTPSWLSNAGTNSQGLSPYQQYNLAVVYLSQNIAIFESLNVNSSEQAPAPCVNSLNATEFYNSPYIAASTNTAVLSNATEPSDFKTNQIIILLEMTMSLLHFIQLTTTVPNISGATISLSLQFNVRYGERRGAAFKEKVANMADKIEPGSKPATIRRAGQRAA